VPNAKELIDALERLRPHLRRGHPHPPNVLFAHNDVAVLTDEGMDALQDSLDVARRVLPKSAGLAGLANVEGALLDEIAGRVEPVDQATIDRLNTRLESEPIESWTVSRRVYGARFLGAAPLKLGPFLLWQTPKHDVKQLLPPTQVSASDMVLRGDDDAAVIVTIADIEARDSPRAREIADQRFVQLENLLGYILRNDHSLYRVEILTNPGRQELASVATTPKRSGTSRQQTGIIADILIDHPAMQNPDDGNAQLWAILGKAQRTDLEGRIITAAEWIGKARRDRDDAKAFVQAVFALEALMQYQPKGVLVSPSLTYRMAETSAYLLGGSPTERKQIADDVDEVYKARSSIVHYGSTTVSADLYGKAVGLGASLIKKLLTDPEFAPLRSAGDLSDWVQSRKYR
jgi:hypothetical protein